MNGMTIEKAENGIVAIKKDGETIHLMPEDVFIAIRGTDVPSNHMDVEAFVDDGYLHEVNRLDGWPQDLANRVRTQARERRCSIAQVFQDLVLAEFERCAKTPKTHPGSDQV